MPCSHHLLRPAALAEHLLTVYETMERPLIRSSPRWGPASPSILANCSRRLSGFSAFADRRNTRAEIPGSPAEFNVGSPKQLGEVLSDELGPPWRQEGQDRRLCDQRRHLEELAAPPDPPAQKVLDWRHSRSSNRPMPTRYRGLDQPETRRVHTSHRPSRRRQPAGASTDPNLQNIPIRTEEGADPPGPSPPRRATN